MYLLLSHAKNKDAPQNVLLLTLRSLVNVFKYPSGETIMRTRGKKIIDVVNEHA